MSCFHPNIMSYHPDGFFITKDGVDVPALNKDGSKKLWKFHGAGFEKSLPDGTIVYQLEGKHAGNFVLQYFDVNADGEIGYSVPVPCQQCLGCRIDYSKHWADRIVMESLLYPEHTNFFLTLTYSDDFLYKNYTGESFEYLVDGCYQTINAATLAPDDLQLFMKRLREYFSRVYHHDGIRFYAVGEYGSRTRRPHYHICCFNLPIQDLTFFARNFRADTLYNSPVIESLWGKGYVVIGELNWESAAYTARYVTKKFKGKQAADFYASVGNVLPEFSRSSNRPGIAAQFFDKNKVEIYKYDRVQLPSSEKRYGSTTVPRYFDKLLEKYQEENPEDFSIAKLDKIKSERRQLSELRSYNRRILSGIFDKEYFRLKEEVFNTRINKLSRTLDI